MAGERIGVCGTFQQALVLLGLACMIGFGFNALSPSGIPLVGTVRTVELDSAGSIPEAGGEAVGRNLGGLTAAEREGGGAGAQAGGATRSPATEGEGGSDPQAAGANPGEATHDSAGDAPPAGTGGENLTVPGSRAGAETGSKAPGKGEAMQVFSPTPAAGGGPEGEQAVGGESPAGAAEGAAVQAPGPLGIDLPRAQQLFDSGAAVFVDAREPEQFAAGRIAGALNLPWEGYEEHLDVLELLPQEGTVVTYCDGGECELSVHLADFLSQQGFQQVRVFFGGWEEWQAAGYPTEEGPGASAP